MNADQLKQHILMLRNQRAAVQVQIARAVQLRHAEIVEFDKTINEKTAIALDFDVQIAEHMREYTTMQASKPRTPFEECGPGTQSILRSTAAAGPNGWSPKHEEARVRCEQMAKNGFLIQVVNKSGPDSFLVEPKYRPPAEPHAACRIEP